MSYGPLGHKRKKGMTALQRFEAFTIPEPNTGCLLWLAADNGAGYGVMSIDGRIGAIPDGMELDHLCRVRCCANYLHLEPVTRRKNLERSPLARPGRIHRGLPDPRDYGGRFVSLRDS